MSERIKPTKTPKPIGPVDRDVTHTVVAGMGVVRKLLFTAPITHEGWAKMMLTHIAAAKSLGFTMFEIDTVEATVPRPKQKKQEQTGGYISTFFSIRLDGDEWKAVVGDAEESEDKPTGTMRTTVVRVYALAVE